MADLLAEKDQGKITTVRHKNNKSEAPLITDSTVLGGGELTFAWHLFA